MSRRALCWAAALLCAAGAARAQEADEPPPPPGEGGGERRMERPMPPDPAKIAAMMMEKFDADKDGKLNADELKAALAAHRPPRPPHLRHSETNAPQRSETPAGEAPQGGPRKGPPAPEVLAAKMIAEFAADKTALTATELQKALAAHRPMRRGPGGPGGEGQQGQGPQGDDRRGPPPEGPDGDQPPPPPQGEEPME